MRLIMEAGADRRRSNLPTSDEIAGIIPDEYGEPCKRDIVLTERVAGVTGTSLKRIDQNHAAYMPLHYVLFFSAWRTWLGLEYATSVQCQSETTRSFMSTGVLQVSFTHPSK